MYDSYYGMESKPATPINITIPPEIIDRFKKYEPGISTEYRVSDDIHAVFKTRDLIVIKMTGRDAGKKKKVVSWRKLSPNTINATLDAQKWK